MASSSRPTTPNSQSRKSSRRHSHRSSGVYLLSQSPKVHYPIDPDNIPLESATNTEKFERLSDALDELDSNMIDLSSIHEAISNGFNESFASFLYGLSITMWCVDYPGCPTRENWERLQNVKELDGRLNELAEKVKEAKEKNQVLKEKLASVETATKNNIPTITKSHIYDKRRIPGFRPNEPDLKQSNDDDSYVTNEGSFVVNPRIRSYKSSKIPQPVKGSIRPTKTATQAEVIVKSSSSSRGPNLNQPPRYMRGLFDSSNTSRSAPKVDSTRTKKVVSAPRSNGRIDKPSRNQNTSAFK